MTVSSLHYLSFLVILLYIQSTGGHHVYLLVLYHLFILISFRSNRHYLGGRI